MQDLAEFIDFFKQVPDHRMDRKKLYPIGEILLIAFYGTIARTVMDGKILSCMGQNQS